MGTRCLTYVYEGKNPLMCLYRQFDGYPSGHGQELAEFLMPFKVINGIGSGQDIPGKFANGMGCLAAQMIAYFKNTVGGFYIHSITDTDCWQDYEYHVYEDKVVVKNPTEVIFDGTWEGFHSFCYEDEMV